jgi:hypothetical protein
VFGEAAPLGIAYQIAVVPGRGREAESLIEQKLACGRKQQVGAADHLGDLHGRVIHHHSKLIRRHVVAPPHQKVAEVSAGDHPPLA